MNTGVKREGIEFILEGTQVNFNQRIQLKDKKDYQKTIMPLRPFSARPSLQSYKREKIIRCNQKRPLSADAIFCPEKTFPTTEFATMNANDYCDTTPTKDCKNEISNLPSSQILKSLLSESVSQWKDDNNCLESTNCDLCSSVSSLVSEKSLGTKVQNFAERSISDPGILIPGIKTKPPLPEKVKKKAEKCNSSSSLHINIFPQETEEALEINEDLIDSKTNDDNDNCFLEDLEDLEKLENFNVPSDQENSNSTSELLNENLSDTSFKNWLQENENLILESKLLETQTDIELQNVHKHQDDLSKTICKNKPLFDYCEKDVPKEETKKSVTKNKRKNMTYRTEFQKNNQSLKTKTTKDNFTLKRQPKSILKPQLNKKVTSVQTNQFIEEPSKIDEGPSWMSSNGKHENFLEFLNKLDDIESDEIDNKNPISQRSYLEDDPEQDQEKESSTCEEIASLLEVLEKEDLKSQRSIESLKEILNTELSDSNNLKHKNVETRCSSTSSLDSSSNYNEVLSYLDEVDQSCMKTLKTAKGRIKSVTKITKCVLNADALPKLEDLLNYSTVELAHYVIDITLRLKEKNSCVSTLQTELSKLRNLINTKSEEFELTLKQKSKQQKDEFEAVIKRHQKFIDQLIADKKTLNQQCEGLINETRILEDRYNTNIKAIEQRHKIDLQKAKDMQMAAEKLRREKWIEGKTQKIKEMTVKGLEPELQNMTARHQQELADLRSLHKHELEELELRAARKTQQQCEALRQQLTAEREVAITHERDILRQRLEKLVESEERTYQEQRRRLNAEHTARLAECDERINLISNEKDRAIEASKAEFEDKLQTALRRHKTEMKNLKESIDLEFEVWKNNYRKQQNIKLSDMETQMKEACKMERDREIELVIERLEQEANDNKVQIEQATENRLRRIKEKYEEEIKDLEAITNDYKTKYSDTKEKLLSCEDTLLNLKTSMKQMQSQLQQARKTTDELSMDKNKMREQIKEEFLSEIKTLEEEVKILKNSKEEEMQKIFAKVKLTVARKDELLTELTQNNSNLQEKCTLLENLLEQQRKDYLIKQA